MEKTLVNKILFITLSNIGDVILTLPVLSVLKKEFPNTDITVMVGPNAKEVFEADLSISRIIPYDKEQSLFDKIRLALSLRSERFNMVVDLRHSLFPFLIGAKYNSPLFGRVKGVGLHKKDEHLKILSSLGLATTDAPFSLEIGRDDKLHVNSLFNRLGLLPEDKMVTIAAGAKSHIKRWMISGFIRLCERLSKEYTLKILLVGDDNDRATNKMIADKGIKNVYDITGQTNIRELAYLISLCRVLVTNDSAPMHVASAVNTPTVAIFGPTDPAKYGPLAARSITIRKDLRCSPCQKALCKFNLECMSSISSEEVVDAVSKVSKL